MASCIVSLICLSFAVLTLGASWPPVDDKPLDCPENQEYYFCYLYRCQRTCQHVKDQYPCLPLLPGCYQPGCECVHGYYKNSEGTCIPESECYTNTADNSLKDSILKINNLTTV